MASPIIRSTPAIPVIATTADIMPPTAGMVVTTAVRWPIVAIIGITATHDTRIEAGKISPARCITVADHMDRTMAISPIEATTVIMAITLPTTGTGIIVDMVT